MKITTKTTKDTLVSTLTANVKEATKKDKNLGQRISYALNAVKKDATKVTKTDLASLINEVVDTLGKNFVEPATAPAPVNSVKKTIKKSTPQAETEAPKTEKKATAKVEKKSPVTAPAKAESKKELSEEDLAKKAFTETLEIESDEGETITYKIDHDIKTMEDLYKAMEEDKNIIFAMYWSKKLLKQFPYFNGDFKAPKEFPNDLDLATCLYASDNGTCAYVMSMFTEGMYLIFPDHLEEVEGIRYSNGVEFQIYTQE